MMPRHRVFQMQEGFRPGRASIVGRVAAIAGRALVACLIVAATSYGQAPARGRSNRPGPSKKVPGADVPPKAVFIKFPDWVECVAFSPDGNVLAAGSYGVVKLLDVAEQKELAAL